MESVEKIVETVLGYLEQFDNVIEILTVACLMVLNKNVKKASCTTSETVITSSEPVKKDVKKQKADQQADFQKGLDLYYSSKPVDDMTPEEVALFSRVSHYLGD